MAAARDRIQQLRSGLQVRIGGAQAVAEIRQEAGDVSEDGLLLVLVLVLGASPDRRLRQKLSKKG